jgi:hypothetical protein
VVEVDQADLSRLGLQSNVYAFFEVKPVPADRVKVGAVVLALSTGKTECAKGVSDDYPK